LLIAGLAAVALSACSSDNSDEASADEPASVEPLKGTSYNTITLSADAQKRLGIETGTVTEKGGRKVIPYTAVSYTPNGGTYVYTSPADRTYVRQTITVRTVKNGQATLSRGPKAGTAVVTVGSAELFGTEYEFEPE
jgi:hypothetical protein